LGREGRVVQGPDTAVAHDDEVEVPKGVLDRGKLNGSDSDLEVGVLACLMSREQIKRPSDDDIPGGLDALEPPSELVRGPRVPLGEIGLAQIHLRQRKSATWTSVDTTMRPIDVPTVQ